MFNGSGSFNVPDDRWRHGSSGVWNGHRYKHTKDIMAVVMMASAGVSWLNVAFQLEDLGMFLSGEKPLRAPTGNQLHDTTKAWTEMITGYIATLGLQNPRTYGTTYERLPDVTLPVAANAGASGSTALATQNTGLISSGGASGAGSLALLPQVNVLAANYALAIPVAGNSVTYPASVGGGGTGGRLIPGTEGVVTGGDSAKLGKT